MEKIIFKRLSELLQKEEKLLKSRITPNSLERAYYKKLVHIRTHKKEIVGFVALWPTKNKEWSELGTLWVHPDWRKKGIASELFSSCQKSTTKNIFLITRSMKVVYLAKTNGWTEEKSSWTENNFWKKVCEPWDSVPKRSTRILPKEGRLFFLLKYSTYILECADGTLYVGSTNNLEKRLHQHNNLKQGAHYTKIRRPVKLVYSEQFATLSEARKREVEIKRMTRLQKLNLC